MSDEARRDILGPPPRPDSDSDHDPRRDVAERLKRWLPLIILALFFVVQLVVAGVSSTRVPTVDYSRFRQEIVAGRVARVEIGSSHLTAIGAQTSADAAPVLFRTVRVEDPQLVPLLEEHEVSYFAVPPRNPGFLSNMLGLLFPVALMFFIWRRLLRGAGGLGSNVMAIGKNTSRVVAEGETGVTFRDVAGADEAKAELEEVVDYLKHPERYAEVGGRIPKGILLVGAPGTGKTLLARAVAGEAGVSFLRLSGSDFVEMFVGVGASRVRDLFKQARSASPSIVFIDELDAIGKSRAAAGVSGNDEREQTLNQLLVEMDGFDAATGVIVLAATNRPEVLDPALLRPGRFDRQVLVDKPDLAGRVEILSLHAEKVKLDPNVDMHRVARATAGLAGADLANIVNEAALLAVRAGRRLVTQEDFSEAIEKSIAGLSRRNRVLEERERRIVAYHETGHALVAHLTDGADPVEKISIIPRGIGALGYTLQLPSEERFLLTERELLGRIDVLLAGRAAEQIIFGDISTGAGNDLTRAADIARRMITDYGMSDKFRNLYLPSRRGGGFLDDSALLQREYAESTQTYIDEESARIISDRYEAVLSLLQDRREELQSIAEELLRVEIIDRERFEQLANRAEET